MDAEGNLSYTPLANNPDGSPPNFDNPPSLEPLVLGITVTAMIISFGFICIRMAHKLSLGSRLFAEDYFCFLGWTLALACNGLILSLAKLSRHAWDLPLSFFTASLEKRFAAVGFIYAPAAFLTKASIFATYIRLFGSKTWLRRASYLGIGILLPANVLLPIAVTVVCMLRNGQRWDLTLPMYCRESEIPAIINGSLNLAADICLLILPLPVTLSLSLPTKRRWALSAVFLTGFLGIISSILGLYYRIMTWNGSDMTWDTYAMFTCIIVEQYVTVIVSCAPATASFWRKTMHESPRLAKLLRLPIHIPIPWSFRSSSSSSSLRTDTRTKASSSKMTTMTKWRATRSLTRIRTTRDSSTASRARLQGHGSNTDGYEFSCIGLDGFRPAVMGKPYVSVHASTSHFREPSEGGGIMKSVTVDQASFEE